MRKFPVLTFIILSFLFSWGGWIPYALAQVGEISSTVYAEIIWIAEFGPSFSGLLITLLFFGKNAFRNLIKQLCRWRVHWKWYFLAIVSIPILALVSIGADYVFFNASYDFSVLKDWDQNFISRTEAFVPSIGLIDGLVGFMKNGSWATGFIFFVLALTNGGLSEELGWRGFALKVYQQRKFNMLLSSLFVATLWAIWHTGTVFWKTILNATLLEGITFTVSYLLQYLILVFPLSIIYTILYNGTKGSILLCILLHAFYNITISVLATALPNFPMLIFVAVLYLVSVVMLVKVWNDPIFNKEKSIPEFS